MVANMDDRQRPAKVKARRSPVLTLDQYRILLDVKQTRRTTLTALAKEWDVKLTTVLDASSRGVKRYDYALSKGMR